MIITYFCFFFPCMNIALPKCILIGIQMEKLPYQYLLCLSQTKIFCFMLFLVFSLFFLILYCSLYSLCTNISYVFFSVMICGDSGVKLLSFFCTVVFFGCVVLSLFSPCPQSIPAAIPKRFGSIYLRIQSYFSFFKKGELTSLFCFALTYNLLYKKMTVTSKLLGIG